MEQPKIDEEDICLLKKLKYWLIFDFIDLFFKVT